MKKLIIALILTVFTFSLFAGEAYQRRLTDDTFTAYNLDYHARGGAVLNNTKGPNAFITNPAALADKVYFVELPINLSLYHASKLLNKATMDNIHTVLSEKDEVKLTDAAMEIMRNFSGRSPFVDSTQSISFGVYGFGANVSIRERVLTSGESISSDIILALDARASLGYGYRFDFGSGFALNTGLTLNYRYKTYNEGLGVDGVVDIMTGAKSPNLGQFFQGHMITGDIGVIAEFPFDLKVGAAARNIGSGYMMSTKNWSSSSAYPEKFNLANDFTFDLGVSYSPSISIMHFNLEADLVGIEDWFIKPGAESFLKSLHLGASFGLWENIILKAGLSQGYPSFGLELNILCFHLEGAYYAKDAGSVFGLKGDDALTIELGLSFD